ncbi:MAG: hypothetical protein COT71_00605 [Candidatus Andersenbacteria bacterium CG10_big_fil_rev_8_21_14_0_10_54_11]|uniref:FAD/NAD(P)-binding domain-containing protein n=1 Tax=Candidatus Andersenbacteria bacterium CG10_big_fil_rev_8_21_14_0_10_54_11 TaxID=1974485 RepID=A0A2M6X098_9BACT|nr:MAG: hypothetical protein COT71_00605 [Candidatus Andersenbacteria bacterium CG10_big_fil_rev_8_21_14_0_10_54_11]
MVDTAPYDVGIVGYGPAGITAAIYAARKQLRVVLIGAVPGGEVVNSGDIENWPGGGETDGLKLSDGFVRHLDLHADVVTRVTKTVTKITRAGQTGDFTLYCDDEVVYLARTVIYAAGRHPRELGVPGEVEFKNKGVSYCATCDAPLFPEKDVAVIGGGNTGAEAVIMFQKIARRIYLLHIDGKLRADPILVKNFADDPNVSIIFNAKTTAIKGDKMVNALTYEDALNRKEKTLSVQGVFITIGAIPNTEPVKSFVELDAFGAIAADRYGATNVPGFFAAGDVTDIRDAQIVVAAGHGCSAALSAGDYLSRRSAAS